MASCLRYPHCSRVNKLALWELIGYTSKNTTTSSPNRLVKLFFDRDFSIPHVTIRSVLFSLVLILLASGCTPDEPPGEVPPQVQTGRIGDFDVSISPTGKEQLRRARALSPANPEKQSWLRAVARFHPQDKHSAGLAELELAYLKLGPDHRKANTYQAARAEEDFERVAEKFSNMEDIVSGAFWYIGWIRADILGDIQGALNSYQRVLTKDSATGPFRPVAGHWPSLGTKTETPKRPPQFVYSWNNLARLEIIRLSPDRPQAMTSLQELSAPENETPKGNLVGKGLHAFLQRFDLDETSSELITNYLDDSENSEPIREDLDKLLKAQTPKEGRLP